MGNLQISWIWCLDKKWLKKTFHVWNKDFNRAFAMIFLYMILALTCGGVTGYIRFWYEGYLDNKNLGSKLKIFNFFTYVWKIWYNLWYFSKLLNRLSVNICRADTIPPILWKKCLCLLKIIYLKIICHKMMWQTTLIQSFKCSPVSRVLLAETRWKTDLGGKW